MNKVNMIYICQTYNESHKREIVCIKDSLKGAKEWSHNRTKLIKKANRLKAKYTLTNFRTKESSRIYSKYYKFRVANKLFDTEEMHDPFIWSMELQK